MAAPLLLLSLLCCAPLCKALQEMYYMHGLWNFRRLAPRHSPPQVLGRTVDTLATVHIAVRLVHWLALGESAAAAAAAHTVRRDRKRS